MAVANYSKPSLERRMREERQVEGTMQGCNCALRQHLADCTIPKAREAAGVSLRQHSADAQILKDVAGVYSVSIRLIAKDFERVPSG